MAGIMGPLMFGGLILFMLIGYPVAFSLAGLGLFFGVIGIEMGLFPAALLQALPGIIRESAKPMESIDSIRIVQVEGLGGGSGSAPAGDGNLADSAMNAALRYRTQAPIIDNLLRELGLDGSALGLAPTETRAITGRDG